jgi:hypothetical protein
MFGSSEYVVDFDRIQLDTYNFSLTDRALASRAQCALPV